MSNTGKVQITMVAHVGGTDYYSWVNTACGEPEASSFGQAFFRKASVSVTLSIRLLTNNLGFWLAQLIQL